MSKRQILSVLGVWIMVFLFLGIPPLWHKIIALISGIFIIFISYNIPHNRNDMKKDNQSRETFVENK